MPSSAVRQFTDPDDFTASIRATQVELTVTGRGDFAAKLARIDLHRLWMQRFEDNLPRVAHAANVMGRAIIAFIAGPGPDGFLNGRQIEATGLRRYSDGQTFYERSTGFSDSCTMSLPIADMVAIGAEVAGSDFAPPARELTVIPAAAAMARLRRLHAAATHLANQAPEMIAHPEAARGLEQGLIHALAACLSPATVQEDTAANRRHDAIMRRFRAVLEANPDRAIHLPELCSAIGVSDRTLRACCQEQLGMGPQRYLWLRRMNFARNALAKADRSASTVTEVATAQGFWELGRFSVDYQTLFGERPSTALHRPAADP